jgi:hypothetical protein
MMKSLVQVWLLDAYQKALQQQISQNPPQH